MSPIVTTTKMDRCTEFINEVRGSRFIKIRDRQVNKFNRLAGNRDRVRGTNAQFTGNNNQSPTLGSSNKWVIKLSNTPYSVPRVLIS